MLLNYNTVISCILVSVNSSEYKVGVAGARGPYVLNAIISRLFCLDYLNQVFRQFSLQLLSKSACLPSRHSPGPFLRQDAHLPPKKCPQKSTARLGKSLLDILCAGVYHTMSIADFTIQCTQMQYDIQLLNRIQSLPL